MRVSLSGWVTIAILGVWPASAQVSPPFDFNAPPVRVVQPAAMRSLPGQLDSVPLFNSNSPEWVKAEGILLSTLPPTGKQHPEAHLNYAFQGDFNLFAHHFSHTPRDLKTLYIGILLHNPGTMPVTVTIPAAASVEMRTAPFQEQPPLMANPTGAVAAGPGSRAVDIVMRGERQPEFPAQLVIPPGQAAMLMNLPIPVRNLEKAVNGRSTFIRAHSDRPVYAASLAMYAPVDASGAERPPTLAEWQRLLTDGTLAGPRDRTPTPPDQQSGELIYGRVAGVQMGSTWNGILTDPGSPVLSLPARGEAIAYGISTLRGGRLGTEQSRAAPLIARYPDTAYEAHGNYGVTYDLTLPLFNPTPTSQTVALTLATPLKEDRLAGGGLQFRTPPLTHPFFRGTVYLEYPDEGYTVSQYMHLWHRAGQVVEPLLTLTLPPRTQRSVDIRFIYPPDVAPPQALIIQTEE